MKKRTIALMLSVLAVMMLIGVGFASWVITQGASNEQSGNIVVDTVTDNRVYVSVELKDGENDDLIFGWKDSDPAVSNPWLSHGAAEMEENMSTTFLVHVTDREGNPSDATVEGTLTLNLKTLKEESELTGEEVLGTATKDYALPQWVVQQEVAVTRISTGEYEVTISFKWADALKLDGSDEEGSNPYIYFNAGTSAGVDRLAGLSAPVENNADAALRVLKDLEKIHSSSVYLLTIEVSK